MLVNNECAYKCFVFSKSNLIYIFTHNVNTRANDQASLNKNLLDMYIKNLLF